MKKLVAVKPHVAELVNYEEESLKPNEVRIKVHFAAPKHGTEETDFADLSPFAKEEFDTEWNLFLPRKDGEEPGVKFGDLPLGNMVVGHIIEVGTQVSDFKVGDTVCTYGQIKETVTVNAINNHRLLKMKDDTNWKNAVCYDPLQFAISGVREGQVRVGDNVSVFGLGAIGQLAIQLAKKAGANTVVGIDPIEHRREIAKKYGADYVIDPVTEDAGLLMKKYTNKLGMDCIIEASGSDMALQAALRGIAYGGIISYVAFAHPFTNLKFGREAHFNNAKIVFARAASEPNPSYPRWDRKRIERNCWKLLMENYVDCTDIIDPVVPFEESAEGFMKYVDQEPTLSIKMGVKF